MIFGVLCFAQLYFICSTDNSASYGYGLTCESIETNISTGENTLKKSEEKKEVNFISKTIVGFFLIVIIKKLFPHAIPLPFFYWRDAHSNIIQVVSSAIPVFTFGIFFVFLVKAITKNNKLDNQDAEEKFVVSIISSLIAGVTEEIAFRWILFLIGIVGIQISDYLLGGFIFGHGLLHWVYIICAIPLADILTFHQLTPYLYNPLSWAIGGSIISTNAKFSDGHSYQGVIGWIDSWFFGIFMYKVVWECGLLNAIIVHTTYNIVIHLIVYIDRKIEQKLFG